MMSSEYIAQLAREAAKAARRQHKEPFVPESIHEIEQGEGAFSIPNLGDYRPKGWKLIEHKLVDNSGFGSPGEPALTRSQFLDWLKTHLSDRKTSGYGIIEVGQFQVVVGRFEHTASNPFVQPFRAPPRQEWAGTAAERSA